MKFQEIFETPGLYVADTFREGVAIEIALASFPTEKGQTIAKLVTYNKFRTVPLKQPLEINSTLFKKVYVQIYNINQLFGEQRQNLFKQTV